MEWNDQNHPKHLILRGLSHANIGNLGRFRSHSFSNPRCEGVLFPHLPTQNKNLRHYYSGGSPQIHFDYTSDGNTRGDWILHSLAVSSLMPCTKSFLFGDAFPIDKPGTGLAQVCGNVLYRCLRLCHRPGVGIYARNVHPGCKRRRMEQIGHIITRICSIMSICVVFKLAH